MDMAIYKLFIFLNLFYIIKSETDIEIFQKLSEVNGQWLLATSLPEAARLLQHPPYVYHSKSHSVDYPNVSELFSKNSSDQLWDDVDSNEETGKCSDDLLQVLFNIRSQWALQMLDSNGKLTSGILRGGLIWPGHYRECLTVHSPLDGGGHGDFHGQYCIASLSLNLGKKYPNLPLTVGICMPDSCSEQNIKIALKNISHLLDSSVSDHFPVLKQYSSFLSLKDFSCKLKTKNLDIASIIYLTIVLSFIFLSVIGSVISVSDNWRSRSVSRIVIPDEEISHNAEDISHISRSQNPASDEPQEGCAQNITHDKETSCNDKAFLVQNDAYLMINTKLQLKQPAYNTLKKILLCFSVFKNGEKILNTDVVSDQLLSIHGIRFLSLSWVILGHTYISSVSMIGNRLDVLNDMDSFLFQMLLQSPFSVDSFFVLSGFLVGYLFLKEAAKKNGKVNWLYFYVHRFWRLTPTYMVVVFFYMLIFKYLGSGPFWDDNQCDSSRSSWWKYLLYINNFIPIHQMCLGWSWYLANDMQFYIISPLFLYPLWRWPAVGFSILAALLIGTWTTTGILSYKYDLIPMFVGVTQASDFNAYAEKMWNSFDLIYDKPYCRIAPYLLGVALGYILHQVNQRKNFLNWWQQVLGWSIAAFCSLSVVFGLYHVEMSRTTALFYNTLCRSSFSIGLCWIIFVCETGHGGFISKLLSWKFWIPLSRLTYCAYLIHPILIHGYYQAYQTALHFTELIAVTNFMGFLIMSYGLAFFFSVTFESPLMNLEKLVIKNKQK